MTVDDNQSECFSLVFPKETGLGQRGLPSGSTSLNRNRREKGSNRRRYPPDGFHRFDPGIENRVAFDLEFAAPHVIVAGHASRCDVFVSPVNFHDFSWAVWGVFGFENVSQSVLPE
jgi:hypothetical protein